MTRDEAIEVVKGHYGVANFDRAHIFVAALVDLGVLKLDPAPEAEDARLRFALKRVRESLCCGDGMALTIIKDAIGP